MFEIRDVDFKSDNYGIESYLYNWPMVYILENGKKAYVGQTTSIMNRMAQHKANDSKQIFKKAHFIYSDEFNQSVTFDYESKLISLMAADNKFVLTNQNVGVSGVDYYNKTYYNQEFKELWRNLQKSNLVDKSIEELQQSDLFKYSPYKELNKEQRNLVAEIIENLRRNIERRIIVNGMPGSGKTVVAIYLFKLLREIPEFKDLKIGMVVPPTSLRKTIEKVFRSINGLSTKDILGPNDVANENYDILLVDEAHRLKRRVNLSNYSSYDNICTKLQLDKSATQLDWILKQTKCVVLFYDRNQIVFPAGLAIDKMINNNTNDTRMLAHYTLFSQMRCLGGSKYLNDINDLLHNNIDHKVNCEGYEFKIADSFKSFENIYREKEKKNGLTRMMAGYAWPWKSKDDQKKGTDNYDIMIEGYGIKWNSCLENWVHSANAVNEVGCIHSTQGYDLNYGFVIIGEDMKYDPKSGRIYADRNCYYDKYGKNGTTEPELEEYIKNIYYVLMSRGIKGTYLYICNKELKEYMSKYIDTASYEVNSEKCEPKELQPAH